MLLKSKTNIGPASPKSSSPSMPMSADGGAKPASAKTDEATKRATEAAVAKAKEVIRNGGTQADAAAAAREVARSVLKDMMRGSPIIVGAETSGGDSGANSGKGRSGGLPPLVPRNAGAGGRVGLLSKFRKKMKSSKEKKMKSVIEEKSTQQVAYGNENGALVNLAIEDSRDEVEVVPSIENQDVANAEIVHSNGGDADERQDDIASNSSPAANAISATKEEEAPQLVTKYSSETTVTDSTYTSTYDDLDSYDSERVHHPRASYYIKDRREADDKDSVASEIDIFDALNVDSFLDALDDALFPVGAKNEGAKDEKKKTSKRSHQVDYGEDERQCSCWNFFTGSGNCSAVNSRCDSSIGYSSMMAGGDSIQSDYVGRGYHSSTQKSDMLSKPVARAPSHHVDTFDIVGRGYPSPNQKDDMIPKTVARESTHHVDTSDTVSKIDSASLSQKEGDDIMKHSKSVSWADKNRSKPISAKESGEDRSSHVHNSGQKKTLSKLNTSSAAQHKDVIESFTKAEDNSTKNTKSVLNSNGSKVRSEEDGTVTDGSISSKMKILFRNTMVNNPLWGAANAANQCHLPTCEVDVVNNPEVTVAVNTENDDLPPNWRDTVVDTVETTARPLSERFDQLQIHNIQQHHVIHPPGQGYFQQQQQTVSPFHIGGGFHRLSTSSHNPQGVGFQTNHSPAPLTPQRYSTMNSPPQGNYYQTINGDGGQWPKQPEFPRYEVGQQHPIISSGLPQINSNLSVVSADDKRDRYAGMEQQQEPDRYNQTMVTPGPYQVPVMGSPAVGGYGNTQQTGHQGGSGAYNIRNDTVSYPNTNMVQHYNGVDGQNMLPQSMGQNSFRPNAYVYQQQQQQQQLEQQHNQPRQQFGMDNGQQYMQSPRMYT